MIDFQEELEQYKERIDQLAQEKRYAELRDLFLPMEPADIALLLEEGKQELMPLLYRLLPKETAAEVFVELESDSQEMLINGFSNTELTEVLDELYLDDAVDIVEEMPASVVIRILDKATPEMRKSINEMLQYPEDSAGSIMNVEYLSLKKDMTVDAASTGCGTGSFSADGSSSTGCGSSGCVSSDADGSSAGGMTPMASGVCSSWCRALRRPRLRPIRCPSRNRSSRSSTSAAAATA